MPHTVQSLKLAIIGLGYVGLPLAVEFGKKRNVLGYDVDQSRIAELLVRKDNTLEVSDVELKEAKYLRFTSDPTDLHEANCYIIAVPTPIDEYNRPDLSLLIEATKMVARVLNHEDLVIYESTVYPGCTEEDCVPILEMHSGLKYFKTQTNPPPSDSHFHVGYSPERINPGDKEHRLTAIKKVTSGSTPNIACLVDGLYKEIIKAGTHKAESIKVAEAAKIIENTQRDLNIALINELALIFRRLDIDTEAVLKAASTKWNFMPFRPGLVGGHCIGVDPYYLTYKAQSIGYNPEIVLAGRRINDGMGAYVALQLIRSMAKNGFESEGARVLVLGLTFKENCPDIRNTGVVDIVFKLQEYNIQVDVYDPWVIAEEVQRTYGILPIEKLKPNTYAGIVLAVAHGQFKDMGVEKIRRLGMSNHVLYDLKYMLRVDQSDVRL